MLLLSGGFTFNNSKDYEKYLYTCVLQVSLFLDAHPAPVHCLVLSCTMSYYLGGAAVFVRPCG